MTANTPVAISSADVEIDALIETLHRTEQRLEQLTAGEVDAVSNRAGHTVLLQRSQELVRKNEASSQAAILDALPAHVALLDAQGCITSVNESWRRFAQANFPDPGVYGIGADYLATFSTGPDAASPNAARIRDGIRSVLDGHTTNFTMEYPYHTADERRWFRLTVTALANDQQRGAVIMHLNVTAESQSSENLLASELRFRQMAENIRDVFFLRDAHSERMLYVSPAYEEIWGRSCESLYANPASWSEAIHPDDREVTRDKDARGMQAGEFDFEFRIVRPDGSIRWIESRGFPIYDETLQIVRVTGVAQDITGRKESEHRIAYLNRVFAMLSGINTLIVRVRDRQELFKEACRISVESGGFHMAWIGMVDATVGRIVPVASAGMDEALLESVRSMLAVSTEERFGRTMAARAIREQRPMLSNDSQADQTLVLGKRHAAAGIRSLAVLPLFDSGTAVGVLALYAGEIEFFHDEEMKLLSELTGDIGFAINYIDKKDRLDYLAYYDVLTGLANRSLFIERLAQCMRSAAAGGHKLALFLIDLERFKNINDSLGWATGDTLLSQVSEWLTSIVGDVTLLARVGADQFAIVLPELAADGNVVHLLEKYMRAFLEHPFRLNEAVFRISAKGGAAIFPEDGGNADTLFKNAEAALKKAKAQGERYLFYTRTMTAAVARTLTLENKLRQALENEEFVLHYQPKMDFATGSVVGAEALLRWNDPQKGLVPPALFIPILEEMGLINDVGRWALHKAIGDYLAWRNAGLSAVRIAVNVSPLQLRNRDFVDEIARVIGVDANAAAGLELEITESVIMEDIKHSIDTLEAVRKMGVRIAIDDFGTGFSSLGYLARLPIDTLKIDRSFVVDMTASPGGLALVSTIITLAHSLKLDVVAEGVETVEQARLLRAADCDGMQGFLYGRPVAREEFQRRYLLPSK